VPPVYALGHSTLEPQAFVAILQEHGVTHLADVRTVPRSRRVPWTSVDVLPGILAQAGIAHSHRPGLGGLRKPRPDSVNTAWRNDSFRGYADHMQTPLFEESLDALVRLAARETVALMCAEAVPWRCHRSLLADALVARGIEVLQIVNGKASPHKVTPFARIRDGRVTYPAAGGEQARLPIG
jgi:uncharacterized protein (DUF488 family)